MKIKYKICKTDALDLKSKNKSKEYSQLKTEPLDTCIYYLFQRRDSDMYGK